MDYQYTFTPIAADEYEEAFQWYEERSVIAADNFILAVDDAIKSVCMTHTDLEISIKHYAN